MSHKCSTIIFRCMDFRIKPSILSKLLENEGCKEGDYDLVSCAGSCKDLISAKQEEATFLWKQITLSQKLHQISQIVIINHEDCGAYDIPSKKQEERIQRADLKNIVAKIKSKFPELKTKTYIIKGLKNGDLSLLKI